MNTSSKYLVEEYRGRINRVMDYIERNMDKSFTLEELASVANFSKFHFSRIFWAMSGETPFEFLMRIRVEKAASLLIMNPKETISEISILCGFSSLPVLSRNFKSAFGMSPSQWRERYLSDPEGINEFHRNNRQGDRNSGKGNGNINNPKRNYNKPESNNDQAPSSSSGYFSLQYEPLKWRTNMEINKGVEVKELPKTTVAYVRHTGPYKGDEELFERLYGDLFTWAGPRNLASQEGLKTFNIYHDDPGVTEEKNLRLSVGLSVPPETKVDGKIGKLELDAGKYVIARFELGPMDYQKAWSWLFGEWFPSSGYQPGDGPSFEMCGEKVNDDIHSVDICVPVKPM